MKNLGDLLQKTSRTFALTIPMLPEPTREQVGVGYLLFRIIDTFEDSTRWTPEARIAALNELAALLASPDPARAQQLSERCSRDQPVAHEGYLELLGEIPFVIQTYQALSPASRELLKTHVLRTAYGMAGFAARMDDRGALELHSLPDLQEYCYVVAGVVGELLTELFLLQDPRLGPSASYLRERSRAFGEGLQLVNILKDAQPDAKDGRVYLPPAVSLDSVFALARQDLRCAAEYTTALQNAGADVGLIRFNALLVKLAQATLDVLRTKGPGSKLSRTEVFAIVAHVTMQSEAGRPIFPLEEIRAEVPTSPA